MRNLHLLSGKLAYRRLGEPDFSTNLIDCNLLLTRSRFDHERDYVPPVPGSTGFTLKVAYPGLLVGVSAPRGVGRTVLKQNMASGVRRVRQAQDFTGSMSLDYTSGQPYIPGSTVKGMLRRHFRHTPLAVAEILGCAPEEIPALERALFEEEDVFFDAVVFDSDHRGRVLGREAVALHDGPTGRVRQMAFLKIRPGVRFHFRFMPTDGGLSAKRKLWLYRELLLLFGVGSRTRQGYGILLETDESFSPKEAPPAPDENRRKCPHCASMIYRRDRQGRLNTYCYRCRQPLPPLPEEDTDHATL